MDVAALTKLLTDSPLPAVCALLVAAVVAQQLAIWRGHKAQLALLERVMTLAAALAPLVEKARRKREEP